MAKSSAFGIGSAADKGYRSYFTERFGDRFKLSTVPVGESRTKQAFKDECDIDVIMRRYQATGVLPGAERALGARYLDCRAADFQEAQLLVASAKSAFAEMPSSLRTRFDNDPRKLMQFLEDERNLEEARELGLVNPAAKVATPLAVRVVEAAVADPVQTSRPSEGAEPSSPAKRPSKGA
ncbi:MAG: internal scaffolding protein [Microviridae sp.]|nr:MAG: internal scaffolding protein [Microviridae sp.]